jgi:hypothetical protein
MKYSLGVPSFLIWSVNILTGLYFLWLGYQLTELHNLNPHGLLILGGITSLYHIHLWYFHTIKDVTEKQ